MKFDHRTAVITGAAGRIGRALCEELGSAGVALALADIQPERTESLAAELRGRGYRAEAFVMDVTDTASVQRAAEAILKSFGGVDILVNNAGSWPPGAFLELEEAQWNRVMEINLNSVFRVTKAFLPQMVERGYGRIVNLTSIAGEVGIPGYSAYSVSKAGVLMLTKTLAMELAKKNITVNAVSPGMIADAKNPNAGTWVGRSGTGDEVARVIAFLSADESGFITGVDYPVEGGRTLGPHNASF